MSSTTSPTAQKSRLRTVLMLVVPALLLLIATFWWWRASQYVTADNAYVQADKVLIAPEVSGRVVLLPVAENQVVAAGDLLFRIDPQPYRIALDRAEANLAAVANQIAAQRAAYRETQARLEAARDNARYAASELQRKQALARHDAATAAAVDALQNKLLNARAAVAATQAEQARILAGLNGQPELPVEQQPAWLQAKAARDKAALDLANTEIRAPEAGVVSALDLEKGEMVAAGHAVFALLGSGQRWVEANLKETELTDVHVGQPVSIVIDAYPDYEWQGTVESISAGTGAVFSVLPPQNATGNWVKVVQRIPVRIRLATGQQNPVLRAGMSAEVTIAIDVTESEHTDHT